MQQLLQLLLETEKQSNLHGVVSLETASITLVLTGFAPHILAMQPEFWM